MNKNPALRDGFTDAFQVNYMVTYQFENFDFLPLGLSINDFKQFLNVFYTLPDCHAI